MRNTVASFEAGMKACATRHVPLAGAVAVLLALSSWAPSAQNRITTHRQQFGFAIGADYHLANYKQLADY